MEELLGVCVLTYNSESKIAGCLSALLEATDEEDVAPPHIVVVDNCSSDATCKVVQSRFPTVELIAAGANLGYAQGNNLGARRLVSQGCRYLAFVNPDVLVNPQTLRRMIAVLRPIASAGMVGGVLVGEPSPISRAYRNRVGIIEWLLVYNSMRFLPVLKTILGPAYRWACGRHYRSPEALRDGDPVYAVAGGCFIARADAFVKVGMFDPRTFLYSEELILSERMSAAGYTAIACPSALYSHPCGSSSTGVSRRLLRNSLSDSEQVLFRHYYGWRIKAVAVRACRRIENAVWRVVDTISASLAPFRRRRF